MTQYIDIIAASVYVGTFRKYNEGSIFGEWLHPSDYTDREEFYEACAELHDDEQDPEFMFQDWENIPDGMISENVISEHLFEIIEALTVIDENQIEPFFIWCNNGHHDLSNEDVNDLIGSFQEEYIGKYDSDEDFAIQEVDSMFDLDDSLKIYFDYDAYARDLFCGDYWSEDGYVFRTY